MKHSGKRICVYCGSGKGNDPAFEAAAKIIATDMLNQGIELVFGGGDVGLMGIISRTVADGGGKVYGITPAFLAEREKPRHHENISLMIVEDMHVRKRLMFEKADAFIALPGGIGTLEELVEQLTWAQLGRHCKPISVVNVNQFWDPLRDLLTNMRRTQFIRPDRPVEYSSIDNPDDVISAIIGHWDRLALELPGECTGDSEITAHF